MKNQFSKGECNYNPTWGIKGSRKGKKWKEKLQKFCLSVSYLHNYFNISFVYPYDVISPIPACHTSNSCYHITKMLLITVACKQLQLQRWLVVCNNVVKVHCEKSQIVLISLSNHLHGFPALIVNIYQYLVIQKA